ncbi:hypothetical protein GYH30_000829 [Glycine max]|nr:hypothetical protein GYH30_000829 [Glycine max]
MPSTSFIVGYHAFLWSGEGARERDNNGKGERDVCVGSLIAKQGGREGDDREGESDYASGEASRWKGIAREEECGDCAVRAVFDDEGE